MKEGQRTIGWWHSLMFKIGISLVLVSTLVLVNFGVYEYLTNRAKHQVALNTTADEVIDRLTVNLAGPIWSFDVQQRDAVILGEMRREVVLGAIVKDPVWLLWSCRLMPCFSCFLLSY